MKVVAKETLKNALGETLFVEGKTYDVDEVLKVYEAYDTKVLVSNEIHSETLFRMNELEKNFVILEAQLEAEQ